MIFQFEDIGPELPLVPLAARRALDAAGRRLSLKAWQALPLERREKLVALGAAPEIDPLEVQRLLEGATPAPEAMTPERHELPAPPAELLAALGVELPGWAGLGPLPRYALAHAAKGRSGRLREAYQEIAGARADGLSHVGPSGEAHMVDVAQKEPTLRRAVAGAVVTMKPETARIVASGSAKGDVLAAARLAGIMAAKRTPELVPLCHTVALTRVTVELAVDVDGGRVQVTAVAEALDRTGVEMEAMVAASVAALTLYDMLKAVERGITITEVALLEKSGGRSGHYRR